MSSIRSDKVIFWRGKKSVWFFIIIISSIIWIIMKPKTESTKTGGLGLFQPPIAQDAVDLLVTKENPIGYQQVREDCLSGLIQVPLNSRLMVYAPGWAEYWFYTEDGYKVFRVKDHEVEIKKTILPSCSFRMRGKAGRAIVQLEKS